MVRSEPCFSRFCQFWLKRWLAEQWFSVFSCVFLAELVKTQALTRASELSGPQVEKSIKPGKPLFFSVLLGPVIDNFEPEYSTDLRSDSDTLRNH